MAGEMSGDAHAAGLLEALVRERPELVIRGAGGPKMRAVAGEGVRDWVDQAAVMGVVEVLKHYRWFKARFEEMLAEIKQMKPAVLLTVDYPGFNFRFVEAVRRELPETRVVQYVCPQVWAWKKGRIPKMRWLFDEVLCLLPFEPAVLEKAGPRATFVGHPLVDELEEARVEAVRDPGLVALLPGSRETEVARLFPMMLEVAERLRANHPGLRFAVPAANARLRGTIEEMAASRALGPALEIRDGRAHELMQTAACGVVASGTATVEAAYYRLPYCLVYKLAWPTYLVARMVVKIRFIGLVNILAEEEVVEEFIQSEAEACQVVPVLERFLTDAAHREAVQVRMAAAVAKLGGTGAHERAAARVAAWLEGEG